MKRATVCAVVTVAALATSASAATLPHAGVFAVGNSLGTVQLGETEPAVRAKLGSFFGLCNGCAERTLYFTYRPYAPEGLAVTFRSNRAVAIYTLWRPPAWHTRDGLLLGAPVRQVTQRYRSLPSTNCGSYEALTLLRGGNVSAFYVVDKRVWGFGLVGAGVSVCR
jgi:hypothetical protein